MNTTKTAVSILSWLIPGLALWSGSACLAQDVPATSSDLRPLKPLLNKEAPSMLPSSEDLIEAPEKTPQSQPVRRRRTNNSSIPEEIMVEKFVIEGNSVFEPEEIAKITEPATGKPISLTELLEVSSSITELYAEEGYVTSGAYIGADENFDDGVVTINVVEGDLEDIKIDGLKGVSSSYVEQRLKMSGDEPLNVNKLISNLQLLQLDPLVDSVSTKLETGKKLGGSVLNVAVDPASTFNVIAQLDNARSPSVGTFRRGIQLQDPSLLGFGDSARLAYFNTKSSDEISFDYALPFNSKNGTVAFDFTNSWSEVSEEPFNQLDIQSKYQYYGLSLRQPLLRNPQQEFALGLIFDHQRSQTEVEDLGFGLAPGSDGDGKTRISALRFSQEWSKRNQNQAFGLSSQLNFGIGSFEATDNANDDIPDSNFFNWQGQAQWARQLGKESLFLFNVNTQLSPKSLVPIEQLAIGGSGTVRGYRQGLLLTDNGVVASAEMRLPIFKIKKLNSVVKFAPFLDYGVGWNSGADTTPETNNIASAGIGLIYEIGNSFSARLDYGQSLVGVENRGDSWQENGLLFSITSQPF